MRDANRAGTESMGGRSTEEKSGQVFSRMQLVISGYSIAGDHASELRRSSSACPPCPCVFRVPQWWEQWRDGEFERGSLLYRARVLYDAFTTHQHALTRPVPGYLKARVEAGLALPRIELVPRQWGGAAGEGRKRSSAHASEVPEPRHAMVEWVVSELSEELFTELMQGFPAPRI